MEAPLPSPWVLPQRSVDLSLAPRKDSFTSKALKGGGGTVSSLKVQD